MFFVFFFFKQKTAYEMRISDWSSDVCSSDLAIEDGLYQPSMKARMAELEREKAEITARLAEAPVGIPYVHPGIAEIHQRKVAKLTATLEEPQARLEASADIRKRQSTRMNSLN